MEMVLLDMLAEVAPRLARLDDDSDGAAFAAELRARRPEAFADLSDPDGERAALAIAERCLAELRKIPELARFLTGRLNDYGEPPAVQAGIAYALAYLVCPVELLADDLPGGFGYVDDALMVCALAGAVVMDQPGAQARFSEIEAAIRILGMGLPRDLAPLLRDAADDAMRTVFALGHIPRAVLEELTRQYIEFPARKIIAAVGHLAVAKAATRRALPEAAAFFELPGGQVQRAGGALVYAFDGGDVIPLT